VAREALRSNRYLADDSLDPAEISRLLPLACLSPDIVEAILTGRQPANLTVERLKRLPALRRSSLV
jgi:hypothetical protein